MRRTTAVCSRCGSRSPSGRSRARFRSPGSPGTSARRSTPDTAGPPAESAAAPARTTPGGRCAGGPILERVSAQELVGLLADDQRLRVAAAVVLTPALARDVAAMADVPLRKTLE